MKKGGAFCQSQAEVIILKKIEDQSLKTNAAQENKTIKRWCNAARM